MGTMVEHESARLVAHIQSLPDFKIYTEIDGNYGHVGATLADAVLQANNNYERNVRHRIARILKVYSEDVTLTDLARVLRAISVQEFLGWNGTRKPQTFLDLVDLLAEERVDTVGDMKAWLQEESTRRKLMGVRFIGPKTADYLKILVGLPVVAMDRHLHGFLQEAGLGNPDYQSGQSMVHAAADLMKLDRAHLDHSIWRYMSGRAVTSMPSTPRSDCRGARTRLT